MARPQLIDRQWWLMNAFSKGRPCYVSTLWSRAKYESFEDLQVDIRSLMLERMISGGKFDKNDHTLTATPTQRGKDWIRKWRREQIPNKFDEIPEAGFTET